MIMDYILNVLFTFIGYAFIPLMVLVIGLFLFNDAIRTAEGFLAQTDSTLHSNIYVEYLEKVESRKSSKKKFLKFFGLVVIGLFVLSMYSPSNTPKRTSTEVEKHSKAMVENIKAENAEKMRVIAEKSLDSALRPNKMTDEESQKNFDKMVEIKPAKPIE